MKYGSFARSMVSSASRRSRSRRSIACVCVVVHRVIQLREPRAHMRCTHSPLLLLRLLPGRLHTVQNASPSGCAESTLTVALAKAGVWLQQGGTSFWADAAPPLPGLEPCSRASRKDMAVCGAPAGRVGPQMIAPLLPQQNNTLHLSAGETTLASQDVETVDWQE